MCSSLYTIIRKLHNTSKTVSLAVQTISVFSEQWSFSTIVCKPGSDWGLIIHDSEEAKWCMSPTAQLSEELKLLFEKVKAQKQMQFKKFIFCQYKNKISIAKLILYLVYTELHPDIHQNKLLITFCKLFFYIFYWLPLNKCSPGHSTRNHWAFFFFFCFFENFQICQIFLFAQVQTRETIFMI